MSGSSSFFHYLRLFFFIQSFLAACLFHDQFLAVTLKQYYKQVYTLSQMYLHMD